MKYITGIFFAALVLFIASYILLRIWGIDMLSSANFSKILLTVLIAVLTAIILVMFILIPFFKNPAKHYEQNGKGIVQKKIN